MFYIIALLLYQIKCC